MISLQTHISCAIVLSQLLAQGQPGFPGERIMHYCIVLEIPVYPCDILGNQGNDTNIIIAMPGAIFTVIGRTGNDSLIVRFRRWKNNALMNALWCFADSAGLQNKYFLMSAGMLRNAIPRYDKKVSFTAGNILIPIKMRIKKFDFSKDFTLGPVAGIKMRLSHYSRNCINFLVGLGVTSVTINKRSTDGYIEDDTDVPALSPSIGAVFDFFSQTQAGLFVGWDFISNNENVHFIYHGKTWISFGLGFSILTRESSSIAGNDLIEDK